LQRPQKRVHPTCQRRGVPKDMALCQNKKRRGGEVPRSEHQRSEEGEEAQKPGPAKPKQEAWGQKERDTLPSSYSDKERGKLEGHHGTHGTGGGRGTAAKIRKSHPGGQDNNFWGNGGRREQRGWMMTIVGISGRGRAEGGSGRKN